jgi:hypothetical protein
MFTLRPVPKPNKASHKRNKPRLRDRGRVRPEVREEVEIRSGDRCERCGKHKSEVWTLEMAHITRRWKIEETTAKDLVRLCGPSTDSSTCHHYADYSKIGRDWLQAFQKTLREGA